MKPDYCDQLNPNLGGNGIHQDIAKALIVCAVTALLGCKTTMSPVDAAQRDSFSSNIPPPQTEKISQIRRSEDWINPLARIHAGTVDISFGPPPRKTIAIPAEQLRITLTQLPSTAWPFGGIIAASISGPQGINDYPISKKEATRVQFAETCKSIGVIITWWP